MNNITSDIDDHKDGVVVKTGDYKRLWSSILKEEVKALEEEVKAIEQRHDSSEVGKLEYKRGLLDRTEVLREAQAKKSDDQKIWIKVTETETKHNVPYPLIERQFNDPKCDHLWGDHSCACYMVMGEVFTEFFGQTYEELLRAFDKKKWSVYADTEVIACELADAKAQIANTTQARQTVTDFATCASVVVIACVCL